VLARRSSTTHQLTSHAKYSALSSRCSSALGCSSFGCPSTAPSTTLAKWFGHKCAPLHLAMIVDACAAFRARRSSGICARSATTCSIRSCTKFWRDSPAFRTPTLSRTIANAYPVRSELSCVACMRAVRALYLQTRKKRTRTDLAMLFFMQISDVLVHARCCCSRALSALEPPRQYRVVAR